MDFFNDLGKKLTKAARGVQAITRESVENTRLASDIRSAQNELEQLYAELGRAFYESLGSPDAEIPAGLVDRVRAALERLDDLTAQRDRRVRCPGCGAVQSPDARFCSNCGKRMPEDAPAPVDAAEDSEFCPACGAMRKDDDRFCAVCGYSLSGEPALPPVETDDDEPEPPRPEPLEEPEQFGE